MKRNKEEELRQELKIAHQALRSEKQRNRELTKSRDLNKTKRKELTKELNKGKKKDIL